MPSATSVQLRLVLVEDSAMLADMLSDMLEDIDGVTLLGCAADQPEALALLEQHSVDLAIIDLELRQGSGLGVLQGLRQYPERYGTPRKVVFSNYGHDILRRRCADLGVERFFDKSLQLDDLLDFVQAASHHPP